MSLSDPISISLIVLCLGARFLYTLYATHSRISLVKRRSANEQATLAVFLGSGGHTAEMLRMMAHLDWGKYSARIYILGSDDTISREKAIAFEKKIGSGSFRILKIPRARKVHQSYFTSIFTTLYSLLSCLHNIVILPLVAGSKVPRFEQAPRKSRVFADLILLNGPGSCVPIALSAFLPRVFGLPSAKIVYVESLARTRRLSASGKLVKPFVDRFFVQWETLRNALTAQQAGVDAQWRLTAPIEFQGWLV